MQPPKETKPTWKRLRKWCSELRIFALGIKPIQGPGITITDCIGGRTGSGRRIEITPAPIDGDYVLTSQAGRIVWEKIGEC